MVISADALSRFRACQFVGGSGNGVFAMHPSWFNAIEPGTLARQRALHQATAPGMLDPLLWVFIQVHKARVLLGRFDCFAKPSTPAVLKAGMRLQTVERLRNMGVMTPVGGMIVCQA